MVRTPPSTLMKLVSPEEDGLYMSVHVTLNGLRGLFSSFLAQGLYEFLLPSGHQDWTFGVCFLVNVIGVAGFAFQWRGKRHRLHLTKRGAGVRHSIDRPGRTEQVHASIDAGD